MMMMMIFGPDFWTPLRCCRRRFFS